MSETALFDAGGGRPIKDAASDVVAAHAIIIGDSKTVLVPVTPRPICTRSPPYRCDACEVGTFQSSDAVMDRRTDRRRRKHRVSPECGGSE